MFEKKKKIQFWGFVGWLCLSSRYDKIDYKTHFQFQRLCPFSRYSHLNKTLNDQELYGAWIINFLILNLRGALFENSLDKFLYNVPVK